LPKYGETKAKARPTIIKPHSRRDDRAVQPLSAIGGLRSLVRRAEEKKKQEVERKAARNFEDIYVLADGNEDMGCVKQNTFRDRRRRYLRFGFHSYGHRPDAQLGLAHKIAQALES
jgi:hypothetical protein